MTIQSRSRFIDEASRARSSLRFVEMVVASWLLIVVGSGLLSRPLLSSMGLET